MKHYAEIFDNLRDLPISEEMIGAYVEGNLDSSEEIYVSEVIDSDPMLYEISEDARAIGYDDPDAVYDFPEDTYAALELPEIDNQLQPEDYSGRWSGGWSGYEGAGNDAYERPEAYSDESPAGDDVDPFDPAGFCNADDDHDDFSSDSDFSDDYFS